MSANILINDNVYKNISKITVPTQEGTVSTFVLNDAVDGVINRTIFDVIAANNPQVDTLGMFGIYIHAIATIKKAYPNIEPQLLKLLVEIDYNDTYGYYVKFRTLLDNDDSNNYISLTTEGGIVANQSFNIAAVCMCSNSKTHTKIDTYGMYINDAEVMTINGTNLAYGGYIPKDDFDIYEGEVNQGDILKAYKNSGNGWLFLAIAIFLLPSRETAVS